MAVLRVVGGDHQGKVYPLESDRMVIGRESAKIPVTDQGVSRQHAEIFKIGEMFFIQDLGSRNGTFLNATKVEAQELLRVGDRIVIGNTELAFEDRFARSNDSMVLRFGDSIDNPTSTISIRLPAQHKKAAPAADSTQVSKQLELLSKVSRHIGTEQDLGDAFQAIALELAEALNADHVYLFAFDENDPDNFRTVAAHDRIPMAGELAVSRTILKRVRDEGLAFLSSDAMLDDRFATTESIIMKKIKSLLCAPLLVANKPVGAFYATNSKLSEVFSADDLALAGIIGMVVGNAVEMHQVLAKHGRLFRDVVRTLATAAAVRSPGSKGKGERVAGHAAAIARGMALPIDQVRLIWIAGMLHDIGAMLLTDAELKNPLNLEHRKARLAGDLIGELPELADVLPAVRLHNERFDGSGFPEGLKGDAIPLGAAIVGLAQHFDDLLTPASGKEISVKDALLKLRDLGGKKFAVKVLNGLMIAYRRNLLFKEIDGIFAAGI